MRIKRLLLITGNQGKAREFQELLGLPELEFSHHKLELTEIQSANYQEIGLFKTRMALAQVKAKHLEEYDAVLTDDTGLSLDALNGLPGPLIKFFLESLSLTQIHDFARNGKDGAQAVCHLSLGMVKTGEILGFEGVCPGRIVSPRGEEGFGWDGLFLPEGHVKTYAQMSLEEKNQISHRALAVAKLRAWILEED